MNDKRHSAGRPAPLARQGRAPDSILSGDALRRRSVTPIASFVPLSRLDLSWRDPNCGDSRNDRAALYADPWATNNSCLPSGDAWGWFRGHTDKPPSRRVRAASTAIRVPARVSVCSPSANGYAASGHHVPTSVSLYTVGVRASMRKTQTPAPHDAVQR
jgi:hypothetical protein